MYCYDLFTSTCTEKIGIKDAITFVKNVHNLLKKNELIMWFDVDKVFKAWFVCKPLIENCIVPELNNCREVCQYDSRYFAPDLSVGHPSGHFHGVVYDEKQNKLFFKVVNSGYAYAWDIEVGAIILISVGSRLLKKAMSEKLLRLLLGLNSKKFTLLRAEEIIRVFDG